MNNLRNFLVGLVGLLFIMQLALVSPVAAQSSKQGEGERLNRVMDANTNVEEFRQELNNYFTEMEDAVRLLNEIPAVRQKLNQDDLQTTETLAEAKQQISQISPQELAQMRAIYARFPGWREVPRTINSLIRPELRGQLEARIVIRQNGGGNSTDIADNCEDGINANISNTDISIAKAALIAAQAVAAAIPPVLNIPAVAAVAAADGVVLTLETLKAIKDDCTGLDATAVQDIVDGAKTEIINNDNSNKDTIVNSVTAGTTTINNAITNAKTDIVNNDNTNKTAITTAISNTQSAVINNSNTNLTTTTTAITNAKNEIVTNDNSNRTTIVNNDNANATTLNTNLTNAKNTIVANDNTNTTNIVNNDNANRTTIVNNDNANATALTRLLLRTQIEADLATESNGVKVAWYMTPTARGGHLDFVQQIVTETLANIQAAGASIGNAQSFLDRANADKAAGNFKSAYDNYRRAYKAAAN